jgi:hypothetical protein
MAHSQIRLSRTLGAPLLVALILALPACRRDAETPDDRSSANPVGGGSSQGPLPAQPGVDKDDDPKSPGALPRTGDIQGWVKTRPIRVVEPDKAAELIDDPATLAAVSSFRIESLATCRYNLENTSAEVVYIQAATPADAFGLLNLLVADPAQLLSGDRSFRATHMGNAAMRIAAQQGRICVCIDVAGRVDLADIQRAARRLADSIVFPLPAADPPRLVQLIPEPQRTSTKCWLARDMNALARIADPLLRRLNAASVNRALGLRPDVVLSIAAVPLTDAAPAHLIWLAEYPSPADASAAYDRCSANLAQTAASTGLPLAVLPPKGNCLCGAWTEKADAAAPLLKSLHDALPK